MPVADLRALSMLTHPSHISIVGHGAPSPFRQQVVRATSWYDAKTGSA